MAVTVNHQQALIGSHSKMLCDDVSCPVGLEWVDSEIVRRSDDGPIHRLAPAEHSDPLRRLKLCVDGSDAGVELRYLWQARPELWPIRIKPRLPQRILRHLFELQQVAIYQSLMNRIRPFHQYVRDPLLERRPRKKTQQK